jgi:hypothetical protein
VIFFGYILGFSDGDEDLAGPLEPRYSFFVFWFPRFSYLEFFWRFISICRLVQFKTPDLLILAGEQGEQGEEPKSSAKTCC